ncbi:30S ribosomal protein S16 [Mycoplasma phocimorsus]|uniref:Small ribosomal subunit protein bS16 n=1 Tax=Mycoplasma phocimorsus TaxID=3045839 RepID=A0AAJ1PS32_9MOLU|nr:30S ribosomal protein S16 [Mycoplasma phocimorsus]MDJ1645489.1 30S ribosomal protein S16 [Mycoplasma phocimorsus]MDJ1646201.1 30S ribosomal protein S16 [Mycoplasma phocimorsus]MDJ1646799.1 30S ribosomal protein S16 [Mycoplasma phocimorsus]MDJ1647773.1 30S ribosomal protein S16 [Mycoplasma phocimorsus]MDJ1648184.1 30S ribosomal protein S16 [Mycoplasma phocimorsus]
MVKLRLRRGGKKFYPVYKLVAIDARKARDGEFIEDLGSYNPHTKELTFKEERVKSWLDEGAQPTATFKNLLKSKQLWSKFTAAPKK